jgi:hypothetical protein
MTGNWEKAKENLGAMMLSDRWRAFRVTRVEQESDTVRSLYLEPADGAGLPPYRAGQHLPIRVILPGETVPILRHYTLSAAPSDGIYRISVKREGLVSSYLHGLREGDVLEVRVPAGGFTIDAAARRPAVLLAAGIGITPMVAMLRHLVYEGQRKRYLRPAWLFESSRTLAERAFDGEIASLVEQARGTIRRVRTLTAPTGAARGKDYDVDGRIDMALLQAVLPFGDYDFYICGPEGFLQSIYDGLRNLDISDARIHAETFGPSSLRRTPDAGMVQPAKPAADTVVEVNFSRSGKRASWKPGKGSLLDLAEETGLAPEFSCRNGNCGSCITPVEAGSVTYPSRPSFPIGDNEALICCAVPAEESDGKLTLTI